MDENKRILILMPTLFVGGSERQIRYIIEGLENSDIPVTVLVENGSASSEENRNYIELHPGIEFVFLDMHAQSLEEKTVANKMKSVCTISKWILKNVKKKNISWVMFTNLTGLMTVPVCKFKKCKVLFNERNAGAKMCSNAVKRRLLLMCDKIVANSISASEYMQNALKRDVECINNGIKLQEKQSSEISHSEKANILIPARVTPIKNQLVMLKAATILQGKLDFELLFAGQIEDTEYMENLEKYVTEYGLQDRVKFLGYISNIQNYYDSANLIILPSYEEGTPNVLLEAYLNRKLCLASDIIMNKNACVTEEILFGVDDASELATKICAILQLNDDDKKRMLDNNYSFVIDNYNLEKMQQKYVAIFTA